MTSVDAKSLEHIPYEDSCLGLFEHARTVSVVLTPDLIDNSFQYLIDVSTFIFQSE